MANGIFLGTEGSVLIGRQEGENVGSKAVATVLRPNDVNVEGKFFSLSPLDFDLGQPPITTGDYIRIYRFDVGGAAVDGQIIHPGKGYSDGTYTNQILEVFSPENVTRSIRVNATVTAGIFTSIDIVDATKANPNIVRVGDRLRPKGDWAGKNPNEFLIYEIIEIEGSDDNALILVEGIDDENDVGAFVNVDPAAELRLYKTYEESVSRKDGTAMRLVQHTKNQRIGITVERTQERCLGAVTGFNIVTSRELIQVNQLGDQYRKEHEAGMITGQGTVDCFWVHDVDENCDDPEYDDAMFARYLADICLRLQLGSVFHGFFFLYRREGGGNSVWYECDQCIVNNVAVEVQPDQIVKATIDFVMSGPISLQIGCLPTILLNEGNGELLGEQKSDEFELEIGFDCDA